MKGSVPNIYFAGDTVDIDDLREEKNEVEKALKSERGLTLDELYNKCRCFDEKRDLINAIRIFTQQCLVFKSDNKYYWFDQTPGQAENPVTEEIRTLMHALCPGHDYSVAKDPKPTPRVIRVQREDSPKVFEAEPAPPPPAKRKKTDRKASKGIDVEPIRHTSTKMGRYNPKVVLGKMLYVYCAAEAWLSLTEVAEILRCSYGALFIAMKEVKNLDILESKKVGKGFSYRWTGALKYPFIVEDETDKQIVKDAPAFFKPLFEKKIIASIDVGSSTDTAAMVTVAASNKDWPEVKDVIELKPQSHSEMLKFIDAQIETYQVNIINLQKLRETFAA